MGDVLVGLGREKRVFFEDIYEFEPVEHDSIIEVVARLDEPQIHVKKGKILVLFRQILITHVYKILLL